MSTPLPRVGLIGLGEMGAPLARSLLAAAYPVIGYDLRSEACAELARDGGTAAVSAEAVVAGADVVITMLPSAEAFVRVADTTLIPSARPGQVFIEMGTSVPDDVRRIAAALEGRGAALADVPVSGGPGGAVNRRLRMFAGGDPAVLARIRPVLEAIGGTETLFPCGAVGMGSVMKGVNQLKMGLGAAIHLEILAFAVREGLDPRLVDTIFGNDRAMHFGPVPRAVAEDRAQHVGVKFRELPYYIRQARASGQHLPLTETLHAFCDRGERVVHDDHRAAPSFWHELRQPRPPASPA